jgi:hypothetical protein
MVTETLVRNVQAVLDSFEAEGRGIRFAALIPIYPWPSTSYVLLVDAEWLQNLSAYEGIVAIIKRVFDLIPDPEIRVKINRVDIWLKGSTYERGTNAEILVDKVGLSRHFNHPASPVSLSGNSAEEIFAGFLPQF